MSRRTGKSPKPVAMSPLELLVLPLEAGATLGRTFLVLFVAVAVDAGTTVTVPPGAMMVFALG